MSQSFQTLSLVGRSMQTQGIPSGPLHGLVPTLYPIPPPPPPRQTPNHGDHGALCTSLPCTIACSGVYTPATKQPKCRGTLNVLRQ